MTTLEWNRNIICQLANENVTWIYTETEIKNNTDVTKEHRRTLKILHIYCKIFSPSPAYQRWVVWPQIDL